MPFVSTGGFGFGDFVTDLVRGIPDIIGAIRGPGRQQFPIAPGGAPIIDVRQVRGGVDLPGLQVPFTDLTVRSPFTSDTSALLGSPFRPTMAGASAKLFMLPNPVTGKPTWFAPKGRPLLWSGDLTTCKRVRRIARRAKRSGG